MNLPNKITTFRIIMVGIIIILLVFPYKAVGAEIPYIFDQVNLIYFIAFILFLIASISDFFDGYIARKHNLVTNYGKFMDPIADKLLVNSLLIILLVPSKTAAYNSTQLAVPLVPVIIMIARDLFVDGMRLIAVEQQKVLAANIFGKLKTVFQMIAISLFLLNDWPFALLYDHKGYVSLVFIWIAAALSLVSGIIYIVQNRTVFKEKDNAK